ncbi:Scr1 family TA system antitoxin-like transcriptional regulator [Streptomyces sp. NPDC003753]
MEIGGPDVMRAQYQYLLACAKRPNVVVQVMPLKQGGHAGLQGPMKLSETPEQTTLGYMEGNGHSTLVSKPEDVGVLARRYAMIRSQALRPEETAVLIEQLAGEL